MRIAVVNAGSSSLKLRVLESDSRVLADEQVEAPGGHFASKRLDAFLDRAGPIDAVGHRVVHGGSTYTRPVLIDDRVLADLGELEAIAPLHNPPAIRGIRAAKRALPDVPAVACFDTSFHATLPAAAATYAVPRQWTEQWGIRRYGFHGLSHAWCSRRAAEMLDTEGPRRLVTCHLGAGASLAAVVDGRSVDTTMGFTPLEGLVMASRSGSVDPGAVLWVQQTHGLDATEVERILNHESGLLGLTGESADLRTVLASVDKGDTHAELAFAVYLHRLCREIGAMTASAAGLDALVFTGGVGENAPRVRADCVRRLAYLGLGIEPDRNESYRGGDADISSGGASCRVLVIEAREDLEIARQVASVLESPTRA